MIMSVKKNREQNRVCEQNLFARIIHYRRIFRSDTRPKIPSNKLCGSLMTLGLPAPVKRGLVVLGTVVEDAPADEPDASPPDWLVDGFGTRVLL